MVFSNIKAKRARVSLRPVLYVLLLVVIILGAERLFYSRQMARVGEKITIIQGEDPEGSNYTRGGGYIAKGFSFLGDRSLQLSTAERVPGGYFFEYTFSVPEKGDYVLVSGGTPPGPREQGSPWHSPFTVTVDDKAPVELYEEDILERWPQYRKFNYAEGGYYFVKLMTVHLGAGEHTIRLSLDKPRMKDGKYTLYLDAILVIPANYVPFVSTRKLPKRLFEAL